MALGILDGIRSPIRGMQEAAQRGAMPGFVTVALWAAATLLVAGLGLLLGGFSSASEVLEGLPQGIPEGVDEQSLEGVVVGFQAAGIGLRALWPFLYWAVLTLVMYLVTRLFGGSGSLSAMFGAMGLACLPFIISALLQLPIIGIQAALVSGGGEPGTAGAVLALAGGLLSLALLVWHVALVVVGGAVARGISYGRSGGSCATSLAAVIGIPLLLVILLAILLALFGALGG